MNTLFDENGMLNITSIVENHSSFKIIMEDGIITDEELKQQAERTIASLKNLQAMCNEQQQAAILDAISEMSVLYAAYHLHKLTELND